MTWLIVIIVVALIGGVIGYFCSGDGEGFLTGLVGAGAGCGYLIFQIFIGLLSLYLLIKLGVWLFG